MNINLQNSEENRTGLIAVLAALLLAANEVTQGGFQGLIGTYAYWFVRILIESGLFLATLYAIERFTPDVRRGITIYASAVLISLIPFTLAITSLDLIAGLPELGLNESLGDSMSRLQAFGFELFYLFDNHLILCLLLLFPRFLSSIDLKPETNVHSKLTEAIHPQLFHESIEPPLEGNICRIEAQEHYIRITTSNEKRMVLYRFSDAVREMPDTLGMQVHRSHWVAHNAIKDVLNEGQKMQLLLTDDETVPVSRSFQEKVQQQFDALKIK